MGVRVSVSIINCKFHSVLTERKLLIHLPSCSIFFSQGQEGKPGKIGETGKAGEKVCQLTCLGLEYTFPSWMVVSLSSCTRSWIVHCCSSKQTVRSVTSILYWWCLSNRRTVWNIWIVKLPARLFREVCTHTKYLLIDGISPGEQGLPRSPGWYWASWWVGRDGVCWTEGIKRNHWASGRFCTDELIWLLLDGV